MTLEFILEQLKAKQIVFQDVLDYINNNFDYTASAFTNGSLQNASTENQGSARIFSLAQLSELDQEDTLLLFAEHYDAVLSDPNGDNHQNIRQFMKFGWGGISFENQVLTAKK